MPAVLSTANPTTGIPCYCGSGYPCPLHPHIPPSTFAGILASNGQSSLSSTSQRNQSHGGVVSRLNQSSVAWRSRTPNERYASSTQHPGVFPPSSQAGAKRPLPAAQAPPNPKRPCLNVETPAAPPSSSATSLRQIRTAQLAAASLPPSYHVGDEGEGTKRVQAARAIDCWYFLAGTHYKDRPSDEERAQTRLSDQVRVERVPLDLRKPTAPRLRCTECLKLDKWRTWKNNSGGGTASYIRPHLIKEHQTAYLAACKRIGYSPDEQLNSPEHENVNEPITAEGILKFLTEWFAEDDISFNMVSHRGFRRFFSYIGQGKVTTKDIPDRHTVAVKAQKLSTEAKEKIKKEIKRARGKVSCTSDLWTDEAQRAFMCITAHFVNGHKRMVNRLIGFRVIEGDHSGAHLAETFFEVLEEFGVTKKLGMITLDNASNNDTLMAQIEEYMIDRGLDFNRHGNRLRCFPHVVNLAVQAILDALADSAEVYRCSQAGEPISEEHHAYLLALKSEPHNRIRRTAVALRHTQRRQGMRRTISDGNKERVWRAPKLVDGVWRLEEFEMKQLELILDCQTRWSSTRNMIERFLYLYPAISRYIAGDLSLASHAITHMDCEVLYDILDVLNLAHRTQELLSSDKTPTLSLALPLYHALIDQWRDLQGKRPALSHAIGAGIQKLEAYLEKTRSSPAHIVAMALNPSIRYEWIDQNWTLDEASNAREVVKAHMLRCLEEEQRECSALAVPGLPSNAAETATKRLNKGYGSLLASGVSARPTLALFSSMSADPPVSDAPAPSMLSEMSFGRPKSTQAPAPTESTPTACTSATSALNDATVELEHQKFMEEPVVSATELDGLSPIDYWLAKSSKLPLIFKVALDILPAQASSVSSERVFSSSKMTCTQFRNRISAPIVEALQILKHSLRSEFDGRIDDSSGTLDFMTQHVDDLSGDSVVQTTD